MQAGWQQNFGRIAALLGVLGLLLFGASPALAHARMGRIAADAASVDVSRLAPAIQHLEQQAHAPQHITPSAASVEDGDRDKLPSDCPHQHSRACCAAASCPAFSLGSAAGPVDPLSWTSASCSYLAAGIAMPMGVSGLPLTPPPRRDD